MPAQIQAYGITKSICKSIYGFVAVKSTSVLHIFVYITSPYRCCFNDLRIFMQNYQPDPRPLISKKE